ncbi:hypothetical protein MVEN_00164300 [Mycena venus]|uniref:Glycosyltransferase family 4 protein n=1 Tax=Mycena venus TaxID=2733690 RepID=A0A8H6Z116_9AGAR|nr:hypothetical protein MVEN_00164300 [Mycena venus]
MDIPPYSSLRRTPIPTTSEPLRVAIIAENFLPKIDGSTITLAHLLEHLRTTPNVQAMLFGPKSEMREYAGAPLFGTPGVPLPAYPGLSINFLSPSFLSALRSFAPHIIHLVDPIWLGVQTLFSVLLLFPSTPIVTSHHTNLPTYARVFGYPYWEGRTWGLQGWMHAWGRTTLGGEWMSECLIRPSARKLSALRGGAGLDDVVVLCVGRLSPEKNLSLLVHAFAALPQDVRPRCKLVFVGDGPYRGELQRLCIQLGVPDTVFTGQLTGTRLSEAFASGDVVSSPSITETFGQVTLQGMAAGLPVVGLYVEGTADLVVHGATGLLLDPLAPSGTRPTHAASLTDDGLGLGSPCSQEPETGVPLYRTPSNDSAVSLSLDPSPSPSTSAQRRTVEGEDEEDDIPIPDSAVCLSPTPFPIGARGGEGEMEALELPPAQLTLPSASLPTEHDIYPFESPDPSAPRVGCFRTLAPLMCPEAKEWDGVVRAYAGLIGALVRSPSLREDMGKRARALDAIPLGGVLSARGRRLFRCLSAAGQGSGRFSSVLHICAREREPWPSLDIRQREGEG